MIVAPGTELSTATAVVTAADELEEEAAFEAGFSGEAIEGAGPSIDTTDDDDTPANNPPADDTPVVAAPGEPAPAPAAEPAPGTLTQDALGRILAEKDAALDLKYQHLHDKLFGKLGEYNQKIEEIRAAKNAVSGFSTKARERLADQFPELAELLFDGVEEPAAPAPAAQPAPTEFPAAPVIDPEQLKEDLRRERAKERVLDVHEDYEQVAMSPEFLEWQLLALKPEEREELATSWDARLVIKKLTEYKGWLVAQKVIERNKQNLDNAVIPAGVPRAVGSDYGEDDEEAAMLKAYGQKFQT
jgi:hypothetical protein